MSYLSVISLSDAKTYLGVDDTARDAEISRIIKSALSYIEKRTNIILDAKDKLYYYDTTDCAYVFDYPINSTTNTTATVEVKQSYSIYTETDSDIDSITINVGYSDPTDIEHDLIECGYAIIECLFNGGKLSELSDAIESMISVNRRFII